MFARLLATLCGLLIACCSTISLAQLPAANSGKLFYGEMDAGTRVFRFVVSTQLNATGTWEAELRSLDEGDAKFQLAKLIIDDKTFQFELTQTKAKYAGTLDEAATKANENKTVYKGQWKQSGQSFDLAFAQCDVAPVDKPTEVWIGDMKAGLQTLKMQFRIYKDNESEKVFVDSLSQKLGGFKATRSIEGDTITIDVSSLRGKYTGKKIDDQHIDGQWSQGLSLDLKLERATEPLKSQTVAAKRPQTPKPPFPYDIQEVTFSGGDADVKLSGTLTIPETTDKSKKFAAAILVTGSGPQDRDETLLGHKPFWVLADYLTRRGVAVLRYDDRGVGQSTGDFGKATTEHFAADAAAAIDYLKQLPQIDPKHIGIIGHSEGGIVAPMVAVKKPDVAWIVLMAGTAVNGEQILYSQGKLIVEADGGSPEMARRQRLIQEVAFAAMKSLKPDEKLDKVIDSATAQVIEKAEALEVAAGNKVEPVTPEIKELIRNLLKANLQAMNNPWFRFFVEHEPGPVLEKVKCPVLAINGEKDVQVDPKLNLPKIEASLKAGGNQDYKIIELPGLNHLFQTSETGAISQYESIEETISPRALETIGDWILKH